MPYLVVRQSGCITKSIPLDKPLRIGRDEDNDLVLHDPYVSRHHLHLDVQREEVIVEDLNSSHGLLVNGVKAYRRRLADGDQLTIGAVRLLFREDIDPHSSVEFDKTAPLAAPASAASDRRLRLFYDISQKLGATREGEAFVEEMVVALRDVLDCERVTVGLGQTPHEGLRKVAREGKTTDDVVISRSVLDAVLVRRERMVFVAKTSGNIPATMVRERIHAAVCIPLIASSRLYGFLYVDDRRDGHTFSADDVHFLTALAHLAAATLDTAEQLRDADARLALTERLQGEHGMLGDCTAMKRLRTKISQCAKYDTPVLIQGESGTGKELVANAIHALSPRAGRTLFAVNCAAIPETMVESELFGHVKGAFTGADRDKNGLFVSAHKSTLFLDEIGDLSLSAQAKMLRVLQQMEVLPVGAEKPIPVDVRILAATHKDLEQEIQEKRFRQDLYFRLKKVTLNIPALRDREGDIDLLARSLLLRLGARAGKRFSGLTPRALDVLRRHTWPGNVRELLNVLERAVIFAESETIDVDDLEDLAPRGDSAAATGQTDGLARRYAALDTVERQLIVEALDEAEGNMTKASKLLGISWIMLKRRMRRYGLLSKT